MKRLHLCLLLLPLLLVSCSSDDDSSGAKTVEIKQSEVIVEEAPSETATTYRTSFTAKEPWSITLSDTKATPEWLSVSPLDGDAGSHTLTIKLLGENPMNKERVCYVNIVTANGRNTLTVKQKSNSSVIYVETAGTLKKVMRPSAGTELKISGNLNATDLTYLRTEHPFLNELDLSLADIADGKIPDNAFRGGEGGYSNIAKIVLPDNITSIGVSAFEGNEYLESVNIPQGLTVIAESAFSSCTVLAEELNLSSNLTVLGPKAFQNCEALTGSVVIPAGVLAVGDYAFAGCKGLTGTLTLSEGVRFIGDGAFQNTGLKGSIVIPDGMEVIAGYAFLGCLGFDGTLSLPSSLKMIGAMAFIGCENLKGELKLPDGLETVGQGAFEDCKNFTGILKLPNATYEKWAFSGCEGFTGLELPASLTEIPELFACGCISMIGKLTLSPGTTKIGRMAFAGTQFTGKLEIPGSVTTIDDDAFQGCSGFTGTLVLPARLNTLGENAFSRCSGFTGDLTIPDAIQRIEAGTFNGILFNGTLTLPSGFKVCESFGLGSRQDFHTIVCKNRQPPVLYGVYMPLVQLVKVPAGTIMLYRTTEGWQYPNADYVNL